MTGLSLYSAAEALAPLLDQIDPDTGEMPEELGAALSKFEGKGKAVTAYILNQDAMADAIDAEVKKWEQRAQTYRKRAEAYRQYLAKNMRRTGITSITADDGTFTVKLYLDRDESVEIENAAQIPPQYMNKPKAPDPKPSKIEIMKALKAGIDVPGAKIARKDRIEIK